MAKAEVKDKTVLVCDKCGGEGVVCKNCKRGLAECDCPGRDFSEEECPTCDGTGKILR